MPAVRRKRFCSEDWTHAEPGGSFRADSHRGYLCVAGATSREDFCQRQPPLGPGEPARIPEFTQYQVFSLLIDGIRAKEIAARLDLSPKTVDTYRASLMRKLDIHDVAGLVKFAIQREITSVA